MNSNIKKYCLYNILILFFIKLFINNQNKMFLLSMKLTMFLTILEMIYKFK